MTRQEREDTVDGHADGVEFLPRATVTVHDDATPSAHYPADEQERNGAVDMSVTIEIGGRTIEGEITLYRDDANGGELGTCGTPMDGWCSDSIVAWLHTLSDHSRRAVCASLASGTGTEQVEVESL